MEYSICVYTTVLFFLISSANGVIPVSISASVHENVKLGSTINLTCTFKVDKSKFEEGIFADNGINLLYFNETAGSADHTLSLSDDPNKDSVVWMAFPVSLCLDNSAEKSYECEVFIEGDSGSATTLVTLAEPTRTITFNGKQVCANGSTDTLKAADILNKQSNIVFETANERSTVTALKFEIEDKTFKPFSTEDDTKLCSFGSVVGGVYKFTEAKEYSVRYTVTTDSDASGSCTITIVDDSITTTPVPVVTTEEELSTAGNGTSSATTSETTEAAQGHSAHEPIILIDKNLSKKPLDDGGILLYGSTIALLITVVAVAILGLIGLYYCYLVKEGRAAPPPLTATKGIE